MQSGFYGRSAGFLLVIVALASSPDRSAAQSGPVSHVDENAWYAQKPTTVAYVQQVTTLIKKAWAQSIDLCVKNHVHIPFGKVVVHLSVDQEGKIIHPHVISGDAGSTLSQISLDAVANTSLPPMPADAIKEMSGKRVPVDVNFEYLADRFSPTR